MKPLIAQPADNARRPLLDRVEDAMLPLINLVFLMLLFFIVAGHLTDNPLPILPGTAKEGESRAPEPDLTVNREGEWLIGSTSVARDQLIPHLPKPDDRHPLRIAADARITLSDLEPLLLQLENAGYTQVSLLTEPNL